MSIKKRRWAAGLLVLSIVGGLLASVLLNHGADAEWPKLKRKIRVLFPTVRQISTDQLANWLADSNRIAPVLVDSRSSEEFAVSHLPGAIHVGQGSDYRAFHQQVNEDQPVVIYCSVGYRSSVMARELQSLGYTNVFNLEGSIFEWANSGRPVYRGQKEVKVVHPYDSEWGSFLNPELHPKTH